MSSYLFLWNPTKDTHSFRNFDEIVTSAANGTPYVTKWICPSRRPQLGDIAYVQRTGPKHNGVFARGVVTQSAHSDDHGTQIVRLSLSEFLPIGSELSRNQIIAHSDYDATWSPMASGNVIPELILSAIEELWSSVATASTTRTVPDAAEAEELVGLEGEIFTRMIRHRKREQSLRERKISTVLKLTGTLACEVPGCGFDFARVYGELGAGYAQVHHLLPLAQRDSAQPTALSDLAIVCSNCHAMIHRGGELRNLEFLRAPRADTNNPS